MDFLPSTLATSALLLSVSRGSSVTSSSSVRPTSHADVLDTCWNGVLAAKAASDTDTSLADAVDGDRDAMSLRRVLECVELLGSSLAKRYPTVAAAAALAAEGVARYAGLPLPRGVGAAAVALGGSGGVLKAPPRVSTTPVAVVEKGPRCATPTGVEGIMHIEMDAIGSASGGGGDSSNGSSDADVHEHYQKPQQQQDTSANKMLGGKGSCGAGGPSVAADASKDRKSAAAAGVATVPVTAKQQPPPPPQRRRRLTRFTTAAAAATATTTTTAAVRHKETNRVGGSFFSYSDEAIAFARASKRSAEALGHSERGSGFGAPVSRKGGGTFMVIGGGVKRVRIPSSVPPRTASSSLNVVTAVIGAAPLA